MVVFGCEDGIGMAKGLTKQASNILLILYQSENKRLTTPEICYATKRSRQAIYGITLRLLGWGYIKKVHKGIWVEYALTPSGEDLARKESEIREGQPQESQQKSFTPSPHGVSATLYTHNPNLNLTATYVRLHALTLKIPIKNEFKPSELQALVQKYSPKQSIMEKVNEEEGTFTKEPINGNPQIFQYGGLAFRLTTKSLIAYGRQKVEPLDTPIPALTQEAIRQTLNVVFALEHEIQQTEGYFKLMRNSNEEKDYAYEVIEIHIALTNEAFAVEATKESDPYLIAMSEINGSKASMIADKSIKIGEGHDKKGIPEFEGISNEILPNKQVEAVFNTETVRRFYEALGKGYIDPFKMQEWLGATADNVNQMSKNYNTHLPFFQTQAEMNKKMLVMLDEQAVQSRLMMESIVKLNERLDSVERNKAGLWQRIKGIFRIDK